MKEARPLLVCLALVASIAVVYAPLAGHGFVNYDDPTYITANPHLRDGLSAQGLIWAWTDAYRANWQPMTWLSHMLDISLFGASAAGHHLVSLALHMASTLMLFLVLRRFTGELGCPAFVAAFFALHPLAVEPVAWASARREVLSGFFWMLTLLAYEAHVRRPGRYSAPLLAAALIAGLASKPSLVALPLVLLLLDFWPLERPFPRSLREKVPLVGLAAATASIAWLAARSAGALSPIALEDRLVNAALSYARYLYKALRPLELAVFYPHPAATGGIDASLVAAAAIVALGMAGLTIALARSRAKRPWLFVGWCWFVVTLLPTIGLVQFGDQAMADRYAYLPLIGIWIALVWEAREIALRRPALRAVAIGLGCVALLLLAVVSRSQLSHWKDSRALFERALAVTEPSAVAHMNYGRALEREGEVESAREQYRQAVQADPDHAGARNNLGAILLRRGDVAEARTHLEHALSVDPEHAQANYNLAWLLESYGDPAQAVTHYRRALAADPEHVDAHNNLGVLLARSGDYAGAGVHFRRALDLRPDDLDALLNLARVAAATGGEEIVRETLERADRVGRRDAVERLWRQMR